MEIASQSTFRIKRRLDEISTVAIAARHFALNYLKPDAAADVELALVEALTNAIKHGEHHGRATPEIIIRLSQAEKHISVEVTDQAPSIPDELLQNLGEHRFDFEGVDLENIAEGGRGLSLIILSMDDVTLRSSGDEFTIRMIKFIE